MTTTYARWRGLAVLVADAVKHGSRAVERIQKETVGYPFAVLEAIAPPVTVPAHAVHVLVDAGFAVVHGSIRVVTRLVSGAVDLALASAERSAHEEQPRESGGAEARPG